MSEGEREGGKDLGHEDAKESEGTKQEAREARAPSLPTFALRVFAHLRGFVIQTPRAFVVRTLHLPPRQLVPRVLLFLLPLLVLLFLLGRGLFGPRDRVWARIQETGVWRVAMDPSFPPFENVDATGKVAGLDPDLAAAIASGWGVRLEIVSLGFDELMDAVAAGQVDTAISALPVVPHRTEELHFSEPYVDAGIVLAIPAGAPLASREDLVGRRLAVEWGSAGDAEARSLQEQLGGRLILVMRDTMIAALDAVVAGEADAAAVDAITLALHPQRDRLAVAADRLTHEPYVAVVSAYAPDLLDALNASLRSLESDGTLDRIRDRWLRP